MRITLLGATGNLARLTATQLSQRNPAIQLRLTSHRIEGRATLREAFPHAEVVAADWYDEATLRDAVAGADSVLMVTPDFSTDEYVVTPNLIRAIKSSSGIKQLVRFIAIPPGLTADDLTLSQRATRCGAALHTIAKPLLDASGLPVTYVNCACWIMFNLPWFMAEEVKLSRSLSMPSVADAARHWVSETDIAAVLAKVLSEDASGHVGREYLLSAERRYTFAQVAALLSEVLGEKVVHIDDDIGVRRAMGGNFPALMTYFTHETQAYSCVPATRTIEELLGRPQVTLREYIEENKGLFR
jgi:uncharacterized protein YbjT (DUF2867 family)